MPFSLLSFHVLSMTHGTVRLSRHLQVFPSLTGQLAEAALPQRRESG